MKKMTLIVTVLILLLGCSFKNLLKKNLPPYFVNSYYPENKSENINYRTLTLKWECIDPENQELLYDIYFGDKIDALKIMSKDQKEQEYEIFFELYPETTYFYKIIAKDKKNLLESPLRQFSTDFYYPDWWEKQDKSNIYYFGVALHAKQTYSHTFASENAQKNKYNILKPVIKKQLDEFLFEVRVIDTLALKMAQQVMEVMAKADYEEAKIDKQDTMVTKLNYYRTYVRLAIPDKIWNKKLLKLVYNALPLYNELKFSTKFRQFELKYKD